MYLPMALLGITFYYLECYSIGVPPNNGPKYASDTAHARHTASTRARIVEAAAELMVRDGYVGTSIQAIARHSRVAIQTVYNTVGSKRDVLDAVLDRAASGPQAPRPVPEFMSERGDAVTTAAQFVGVLADWFADAHPRVAPVLRLIHQAAGVDDGVAELEQERASRRLANYHLAARQLGAKPGARELPEDAVAATIWSLGHPQVYTQLVDVEGWSVAAYRDWLDAALRADLVE